MRLKPKKIRQAFRISLFAWTALAAPQMWADSSTFDLTAAEVPQKAAQFNVKSFDDHHVLVTGIPHRSPDSKVTSYLTVSAINPVMAVSDTATDRLFGGQKNRPFTWSEADTACRSYKLAGKSWKLISAQELTQLSNFLRYEKEVLESDKPELLPLIKSFHEMRKAFPSQFSFFWVDFNEHEIPTGQKIAAVFKDKKLVMQPMSQQRLLNTVCVTYLSGPDSPDVMAALENTKKTSRQ